MFGRIRSSSSLDSLERPPSKILKDDCLSIYETTLMKLKLGSQLDSSPPIKEDALEDGEIDSDSCSLSNEAMNTEACTSFPKDSNELAKSTKEDTMTVDSDSLTFETFEDCQSSECSTQRRMKNSILYLFSKFKNSSEISTTMEELTSSSASQSTSDVGLHSEQESIVSSTMSSEDVL
ncbi:uncharacterized protein LOC103484190 [Cucumis melo]|uniref:Uncharacterized protein LOC103484190 n=3 Tax=Cucumis melo TaxID=3656 RepID=A0A1S3AY89_CUCME|nr:uncharacterized protein LOC103484190 [Cucumis melo]ADN33963.1 hypothetical protein [Cucumis melo subsp. melo]